jgi:predicted HAD superfamily Cof-like phosphohydrolase
MTEDDLQLASQIAVNSGDIRDTIENLVDEVRRLNAKLAEAGRDAGIEYNRTQSRAFGDIVRYTPGVPELSPSGQARLRWWASQLAVMGSALKKEAAELNEAGAVNEGLLIIRLQLSVEETGEWAEALASGDIVAAFKELVDISVVTDGHYLALGLADLKLAGYEEVMASNMSKLGPDGVPSVSAAGRHIKGPNYRKADMARVLSEDPA